MHLAAVVYQCPLSTSPPLRQRRIKSASTLIKTFGVASRLSHPCQATPQRPTSSWGRRLLFAKSCLAKKCRTSTTSGG